MSKLTRKEKKAQKQAIKDQKRAELEAKFNNASPKAKAVGFGIIGLIAIGIYSCSSSIEPPVEPSEPKQVLTQPKDTGMSRTEAIQACNEVIRDNTKEYADVEIFYLTDADFIKAANGRTVAHVGFEVTNAFGGKEPYTMLCYFNKDKTLKELDIRQGRD